MNVTQGDVANYLAEVQAAVKAGRYQISPRQKNQELYFDYIFRESDEKEILLSQIKNDPKQANKPQQVIDKMITGKLSKYYTENVLLEQGFFFDDTITVGKALAAAGLNLVTYTRFEKGEGLQKREDNFAAEVAAAMSK